MSNEQKQLKFHVTNYKCKPSDERYDYCCNPRPCYLDIQTQYKCQKHEICCVEHLSKLLQKYNTDEIDLEITLSWIVRKNYMHHLLNWRWRTISLCICELGAKTKPVEGDHYFASDILSFGTNTEQIIMSRMLSFDCIPILLILLHKGMIHKNVEITRIQSDLLDYLWHIGFRNIRLDLSRWNTYDVTLTKNYIKIMSFNNIWQHEYNFEELNL